MIFSDMMPRDIAGIDLMTGVVYIIDGDNMIKRQLQVNANGVLGTRDIAPTPIDQKGKPERIPVAQRWAGTDQGNHI